MPHSLADQSSDVPVTLDLVQVSARSYHNSFWKKNGCRQRQRQALVCAAQRISIALAVNCVCKCRGIIRGV